MLESIFFPRNMHVQPQRKEKWPRAAPGLVQSLSAELLMQQSGISKAMRLIVTSRTSVSRICWDQYPQLTSSKLTRHRQPQGAPAISAPQSYIHCLTSFFKSLYHISHSGDVTQYVGIRKYTRRIFLCLSPLSYPSCYVFN